MKNLFFIAVFFSLISCNSDDNSSSPSNNSFVKLNAQTTNDLTDVYFFDNNNGIISGTYGFLAKTTNGGKSWTQLTTPVNHSFLSAFMLNTSTFYTARLGIYSSTNGGSSFNQLGNLEDYSDSIFGIHFFNTQKGIITKGNLILSTIDGGQNWDIVCNEADGGLHSLQFVSSAVGYASGGKTYDGYSAGEMYKTIDGGLTWSKLTGVDGSVEITSMYFLDASVGFYFDSQNQLYKTNDGGLNWNEINDDNNNEYSTSMTFIDANTGFMTTFNGKILKTVDGGIHWTTIYDNQSVPLVKIVKSPNNTIFAVGNEGSILKKMN